MTLLKVCTDIGDIAMLLLFLNSDFHIRMVKDSANKVRAGKWDEASGLV